MKYIYIYILKLKNTKKNRPKVKNKQRKTNKMSEFFGEGFEPELSTKVPGDGLKNA